MKAIFPLARNVFSFFGTTTLMLTSALTPNLVETAQAQPTITEGEAYAIGVDAYVYFYPLVTMDLTRKQSVNVEPGKEFGFIEALGCSLKPFHG